MRSRAWCSLFLVSTMSSCGVPPTYTPEPGERFWAMVVAERWTRDDAELGSPTSKVNTHSIAAVAAWRLGADAPLPRAVRVNDECLALEGSWADTAFSHPSFGELTFDFDGHAVQSLAQNRESDAYEWMNAEGWTAGSQVTLRAAGAAIPAFEKSGSVPPEPTLNSWNMPALKMGELHVSTSQALALDWAPQADDVLLLVLQTRKQAFEDLHLLYCVFPGQRGAGTVPLEAMQRLGKQADIGIGNVYFASIRRERWSDGNTDFEWSTWNGRCARATWD